MNHGDRITLRLLDGEELEGRVSTYGVQDEDGFRTHYVLDFDSAIAEKKSALFARWMDEMAASHARMLAKQHEAMSASVRPLVRCEAMDPRRPGEVVRCQLRCDHGGSHSGANGLWVDAFHRGGTCGAAIDLGDGMPGHPHVLRCDRARDHDGLHLHPSTLGPLWWSNGGVDGYAS